MRNRMAWVARATDLIKGLSRHRLGMTGFVDRIPIPDITLSPCCIFLRSEKCGMDVDDCF